MNRDETYLEWIRLADEAIGRHDYEESARCYWRVAAYFGVVDDLARKREFAAKAGECFLHAAEVSRADNNGLKAILLYAKAADSFQDGGREELAQRCTSVIDAYFATIATSDLEQVNGDTNLLKQVGNYFVKKGNFKKALECYKTAAEKAHKDNKLVLAGGLYRDAGDCYQALKEFNAAADSYAAAAEAYYESQEYFEAAWHYCAAGFLFISAGMLGEASVLAKKANVSCRMGRIYVLLTDLSEVCKLLSEGDLCRAEEKWEKIRVKFKWSYVNMVDSAFEYLRTHLK